MPNPTALSAARRLVSGRHPNEEAVQMRLAALLEAVGYDVEPEYSVPSGRIDIFLPQRRAVIETKAVGGADPEGVRDAGSGETQFAQCERYARDEFERERGMMDLDELGDLPYKAVLTDGRVWWMWRWDVLPDSDQLGAARLVVGGQRYSAKSAGALVDWLASDAFSQTTGKAWAPRDPSPIFAPFRDELRESVYPALRDDAGTKTKRDLWLDVLRASGCAPAGELEPRADGSAYSTTPEGDDLFVTHTVLITVARAVSRAMTRGGARNNPGADGGGDDALGHVGEGFAAWPVAPGAGGEATHAPGADWVRRAFAEVDKYDWRARSRDLLRALYQGMVPPEQRQAFGEFYTPDWLAEMLAERLLDDQWLRDSVERALDGDPPGAGVLDPACGSGTFLYHAARRIARYMKEQGYKDGKTAEVVSRLVHGIDIHPVAVEFSVANVLRALPADPPNGASSVNVIQGDSLIYTRAGIDLANQENAPYYAVETPLHRLMAIPVSWTDKESFADDLHRIVQAANSVPPREMPAGVTVGLSADDAIMVENTYKTLIEVCRDEKDSVWGWYFQNIVGPSKMRRRKANRILANPPWVRMALIQTPERKADLEKLAEELGFWGHGKSNTSSSFDISSLFVKRCAANYLTDGAIAAWVLPQAALDGSNWENVREDPFVKDGAMERMDLGKIRKAPFTVESCVWIQTHAAQDAAAERRARTPAEPPVRILMNAAGEPRLETSTTWEDAKTRVEWIAAPRKLPRKRSDYLDDDGKPVFRIGASLFPHCLVMADSDSLVFYGEFARFTTAPSEKRPWSEWGTLNGRDVPRRWIRDTASGTELFPFALRRELGKAVLPLDENGGFDEESENVAYWINVNSVYRDNVGIGGTTPKTLWERMDFQNCLTRQTKGAVSGDALIKVVYNSSGRIGLRSARMTSDTICAYNLYHYTCRTASEAAYLAAMMNADCLQEAYRQSQRTRRHFHHNFWWTVPIPRYDARDARHAALAALCEDAESVAASARDGLRANAGQIQASAAIRAALRESGIAARIDGAVGEVMGEFLGVGI